MLLFGTKAETLERLEPLLKSGRVLPQIRFTVREWRADSDEVLERVRRASWGGEVCIVRSSALKEDAADASLAGKFTSIGDVRGEEGLRRAIEDVIHSYPTDSNLHQVFIQPMVSDIAISGVIFTRDPNTGSPYIVINYDNTSGSASSITSGTSAVGKTRYIYKHHQVKMGGLWGAIVALAKELEEVFELDALDIEFAIDARGTVYCLQVRPLTGIASAAISDFHFPRALADIEYKLRELNKEYPNLYGSRTVFGVMPDWNPAEIIGVRPRPLALSLYKDLITDSIWAYQRNNYGYKNVRSFPLVVNVHGLPYVDVRVDFNSFLPAGLPDDLSSRLVNYYIDALIASPSHHDKVEFEIVHSCYTFDTPKKLELLHNRGFFAKECEVLAENLRMLTNTIIHPERGLWKADLKKIKILEVRHARVIESKLDAVSRIYWILEECKRYGTLPFAGLARAGFIAAQLLKSLVNVGILTGDDHDRFMASIDAVSSRLARDLTSLSKDEFLKMYGHLRPGTYDIMSLRYDEDPERYFHWQTLGGTAIAEMKPTFAFSARQTQAVQGFLNDHGIEHTPEGLLEFMRAAIEAREYSKFIFTKSLSDALLLLKRLGAEHGFSADDCSFMDIQTIHRLYGSTVDPRSAFRRSIEEGRHAYELTRSIVLPPLIVNPEDVWAFELPHWEPNFITQKSALGRIALHTDSVQSIKNSILFIPSADPGYDWIFSHGIAGLITMYGGVNSHMAIRANELGIPTVIGAGEALYRQWMKAKILHLDCMNKNVRRIQ